MIGITIFTVYLLIGAILGLISHEMVEEAIGNSIGNIPHNARPYFVAACTIIVLVLAPMITLRGFVIALKSTK